MPESKGQNSLFGVPETAEIQKAARSIILAVKRDEGVTSKDLARLLDVTVDTVERLEGMETKKVPASLISSVAAKFGGEYIQPYMALFGHKAIRAQCEEAVNILPALTALVAKIAAAAPGGGAQLNHQTMAAIATELREVDGIVTALRARAADMGVVA
ncbi:hypothetical protein [Novosphingobium olei]|uniref:Uncharacterized protein n=1 Tax=Novosphingobium olei TaxID=2728851 RepID=A0A7Y0BP48_9SPHN|nr:hypothetical protein [Novosphingobium olei]NML93778.1 hypothetical protein [Novosphingobium olei]